MKCEICKQNIEETFLNKMIGTVIKDENGKKHYICSKCQKLDKKEILDQL